MTMESREFIPTMPEKPGRPEAGRESGAEIPEYSYEAGRDKVVARIDDLFLRGDIVVVAFQSSDQHVGKSTLSRDLLEGYFKRGIDVIANHDTSELEERWEWRRDMGKPAEYAGKTLFVFDQQLFGISSFDDEMLATVKGREDRRVQSTLERIGFEHPGVDLWVGICRPDKPLLRVEGRSPLADLIIVNEFATDK